jgi:hypothetical protein
MKTPREILLERQRAANAQLDSIRKNVLTAEFPRGTHNEKEEIRNPVAGYLDLISKLWSELIWPARRIWAGFAFTWLAIAVFNMANADHSPGPQAGSKPASARMLLVWREQERIMTDFNGAMETMPAEKPRISAPRPRSEQRKCWSIG